MLAMCEHIGSGDEYEDLPTASPMVHAMAGCVVTPRVLLGLLTSAIYRCAQYCCYSRISLVGQRCCPRVHRRCSAPTTSSLQPPRSHANARTARDAPFFAPAAHISTSIFLVG
jgi:hypothetical protein